MDTIDLISASFETQNTDNNNRIVTFNPGKREYDRLT